MDSDRDKQRKRSPSVMSVTSVTGKKSFIHIIIIYIGFTNNRHFFIINYIFNTRKTYYLHRRGIASGRRHLYMTLTDI